MRTRLIFWVVAPLGVLSFSCNEPTYLSEHRPLETMADPMGQGGYTPDTDLYVLPVRRPSQSERQGLVTEQQKLGLMMPVPWAGTRDFAVEMQYSLKNLDSQKVTAFFSANGGNEFGDYVPMNYIDPTVNVNDQTPPPNLMGGSPIVLQPNETYEGVFREDQIAEASLDLEAITRYPSMGDVMGTPFEVIEHDSSASRIGLESVPADDVTPLMVRYQLNLSSDGHVVCDYSVRVRELGHPGNKLASPTAKGLYVSTAAMLPPPVAPTPSPSPAP
jgi:hypothetical protein